MRITVTGGTGFVGSHTVAALVAAGHEVRLFARSRERVAPALAPLGVATELETIEGDVTDAAAVERAVSGTEAVIHAASVYSHDRRDARRIEQVNVDGTRLVIEAARRAGVARIVYVSSAYALLDDRSGVLSPLSKAGAPVGAYLRSKAEAERVARSLQADGAPVLISYPGMVWGPHDPYFGETCQFARAVLRGLMMLVPAGTFVTCDVRDVAALHLAMIDRAPPTGGYFAPAHTVAIQDLIGTIASATGRRLPVLPLPWPVVAPLPWLGDALQPVLPFRQPWSYPGAWSIARRPSADDSATRRDLGLEPMPLADSVADTIRWMAEAGYVSARQAGQLAAA